MRIVNWNIERRGPHTWQAASLASEIQSLDPDIVFLTEGHHHSLEALGGFTLDGGPPPGPLHVHLRSVAYVPHS